MGQVNIPYEHILSMAENELSTAIAEWECAGSITKRACRHYGMALAYLEVVNLMTAGQYEHMEDEWHESEFCKAYRHARLKEVQ